MSIQIITNSPNTSTPKTYWKKRDIDLIDLQFDGVDDNIDLGNQVTLWSQALTKFSVSFWIKIDVNDAVNNRWVVNHGAFTAQSFYVHLDTSSRIVFVIRNAAGTAVGLNAVDTLIPNGYYHITCVYDSTLPSDNMKIYLNGETKGTPATLTQTINLSANLFLGKNPVGGGQMPLDGNIKDFRFYLSALSADEALSLYEKTGNSESVPDYWLPLNQGVSSPLDRMNGLTTTLNGAVWNVPAFEDTKLADVISNFTRLKYVQKDPFNDQIIFGLEPTQSASAYQIVIQEGSTDYEQIDVAQYFAKTDVMFDIYAKNAALAENFNQLENMLIGIQEVWMNYNPHEINGLSEMIMQNKDVEKDTSEQSRSSTYYKTIAFTAIYQIARTTAIETNTYVYSNPDIAGEIGS